MHSAPSVSFPVGRSRMARRLLGFLWTLGAAALCAWMLQFSVPFGWRTALLMAAVLFAGLAAWRASRLGAGAELRWDGQHWSCSASASFHAATATIHLDLQSLMLVCLQEPGRRAAWLWLDRACLPARWLDLRRALHAAQPQRDPPEGLVQP